MAKRKYEAVEAPTNTQEAIQASRECRLEGCTSKLIAKGYCESHYRRFKKYGDPAIVKAPHDGREKHPLYSTYKNIKTRCKNKNVFSYKYYGGRGIKICDEWDSIHGFWKFVEYMGEKPTPEHTIDRINNDGNYEPGNVRWATVTQQNLNQSLRKDNTSGVKNIEWKPKSKRFLLVRRINYKRKTYGYYKTLDEAINAKKELFNA